MEGAEPGPQQPQPERGWVSPITAAAIVVFGGVLLLFAWAELRQSSDRESDSGVVVQETGVPVPEPNAVAPGPALNLADTTAGIHRGIVFLRCARETGWTGGSPTCTDYTRRTTLTSLEDQIDTGFTIYNAPVLQFLNPVLAGKIGISLQLDRSPAFPFDYSKFNPQQWRQGNAPLSLDWWLANHPDWIVYTCDRRIAWEYGDAPADSSKAAWVPLDVTNPDVRSFYWDRYVRPALDHGAPLVFFDNLAIHNTWQRCGHYDALGQWVPQFTADYKDPAYQAAAFAWIEWLYRTIKDYRSNVVVVYNYSPAESNDPPEVRDRVLDSLDMVFDEAGFNYWGHYRAIDALWQRKKDLALAAHRKGKALFFSQTAFVTDPASQTTNEDKSWGLANYLLLKGNHDFIGWAGVNCTQCGQYNFNDYGYYVDFPEYHAPIGRPQGPMYQAQGVWMRDFENGRVVVNPDGLRPYNLALGGTYLDPWGNQIGPAFQLASQSALVLLNFQSAR